MQEQSLSDLMAMVMFLGQGRGFLPTAQRPHFGRSGAGLQANRGTCSKLVQRKVFLTARNLGAEPLVEFKLPAVAAAGELLPAVEKMHTCLYSFVAPSKSTENGSDTSLLGIFSHFMRVFKLLISLLVRTMVETGLIGTLICDEGFHA